MQTFVYPIALETSTDGGFVVSCRDLPGVWGWMKRRRFITCRSNSLECCAGKEKPLGSAIPESVREGLVPGALDGGIIFSCCRDRAGGRGEERAGEEAFAVSLGHLGYTLFTVERVHR
jgi:hypothetical protein